MASTVSLPLNYNSSPDRDSVQSGDAIDAILSSSLIGDSLDNWALSISQHSLNLLLDCQILAIEHRKNRKGSGHEYLSLTLRCKGLLSGKTYTRYIRCDRSFRHNPAGELRRYRNLLRGGGLPADDTITISSLASRTGTYSLYEMSFDEDFAPTVLDLAALLRAVTSVAPNYHLYKFMCYWHSRVVYEVLRGCFRGKTQEREKPQRRGKYAGFFAMVDGKGRFLMTRFSFLRREKYYVEMPTLARIVDRFYDLREEMIAKVAAGNTVIATHLPVEQEGVPIQMTHTVITDRPDEALQQEDHGQVEQTNDNLPTNRFVELYFLWLSCGLAWYLTSSFVSSI